MNFFLTKVMKKCIIYIKLMKWPPSGNSKTKNGVDSGRFDHESECINIINTKALMKILGNHMGFVALNRTIKLRLIRKPIYNQLEHYVQMAGQETISCFSKVP